MLLMFLMQEGLLLNKKLVRTDRNMPHAGEVLLKAWPEVNTAFQMHLSFLKSWMIRLHVVNDQEKKGLWVLDGGLTWIKPWFFVTKYLTVSILLWEFGGACMLVSVNGIMITLHSWWIYIFRFLVSILWNLKHLQCQVYGSWREDGSHPVKISEQASMASQGSLSSCSSHVLLKNCLGGVSVT